MSITDYFENSAFEGGKLIAAVQNAAMSCLFVSLFFTRKKAGHPIEGQSFYAAVAKLVGTLLPGIEYAMIHRGQYFAASFVLICLIFDTWYCVLLYKEIEAQGLNPLARV